MPASMIRAPTGSRPKVIGSSMAMVAIGPTPGSTPISVPTRQPAKASAIFCSESATPKPSCRCAIISLIESDPQQPGCQGDRQTQCIFEQQCAEGRHDEREDHQLLDLAIIRGQAGDQHDEGA